MLKMFYCLQGFQRLQEAKGVAEGGMLMDRAKMQNFQVILM